PAMQTGVSIRTTITDGRMKEMYSADKNKQRLNNSSVEVGKVNITAYSSGSYTLQVKLTDSAGTEYASASKKFYIYKPGSIDSSSYVGGSSQDYATSEYAILTEKELDQEYQYARYIVLEPDRVQYEHLKDVNAKRKFLFEFWQKQTARTGMGATEYKQIYIKRVEYANEHFTKAFRQGWKTDRGRVYIMYGPYDDIEQFPSSSESNPYEIWHYNAIQGGVIFVFVDQNNIGQYTLVNSTHRDEIRNDNWYQQYAAKTN
ncbi:MAG TPA: GWxTD domain-containing protein, partial [Bacteroidota bacterium]|nr:GWxTD domain-containing protein [Bacteroidota bacterium]